MAAVHFRPIIVFCFSMMNDCNAADFPSSASMTLIVTGHEAIYEGVAA